MTTGTAVKVWVFPTLHTVRLSNLSLMSNFDMSLILDIWIQRREQKRTFNTLVTLTVVFCHVCATILLLNFVTRK